MKWVLNTNLMKILITGAKGFVGRNLTAAINDAEFRASHSLPEIVIMGFDIDTPQELLEEYCKQADFVFNLAGIMRPKDPSEFMRDNCHFADSVLGYLEKAKNACPVMYASSIQASLDNPYAESKRAGENLMFEYGKKTGARVIVYRFTNLFGRWKRPNADSVVATFCYNVGRGIPIKVNDPSVLMTFAYIDDCVHELALSITGKEQYKDGFALLPVTHQITVGKLAETITSFKNGVIADESIIEDSVLLKELFTTYQSYLPNNYVE